jgi:hypothetical protein
MKDSSGKTNQEGRVKDRTSGKTSHEGRVKASSFKDRPAGKTNQEGSFKVSEKIDQDDILRLLIEKCDEFPPSVVKEALDLILQSVREALTNGRPVTLRSFGRLIPRRYQPSCFKKIGLVFHTSPKLKSRLNPSLPPLPSQD